MSKSPLPDFEKPPLNEVAIGFQFEPLEKMHCAQMALFWSRIRDRYPQTEDQPPILHILERPTPALEEKQDNIPIEQIYPRCWFLGETGLELIQLQKDRFLRNWRQLATKETYPRFQTLLDKFKLEWHEFAAFLDKEQLGQPRIDQCELTYINYIERGAGWEDLCSALDEVITVWSPRPKSFLPDPETVFWQAQYALPNGRGRLRAQMKPAFRRKQLKPILILDLTARGAPENATLGASLAWMELAHEWIVRGFAELTTAKMHKLWGRKT